MEQQQKVERFLKLGYDYSAIVRVLESLRHDAQTNDILEELIKTCHSPGPRLVARGCSPAPAQPRAAGAGQESAGGAGGAAGAAGAAGATGAAGAAGGFRPVVIDGSNVAMSHGDKKVFSCQGLQLAVDWFWDKGLRDITVFIPLWRKEPRADALITDQHILHELEQRKILVYTPSRCVNGKRVVCYDDRYIVKLAFDSDGVIVSNDNYRDLQTENPRWKRFIEERLLMFSFVNDKFMPPDDPLGRNGPTIDDLLRRKPWTPENKLQHCPYGKKCTYGVKCKFYHPERLHQSQLSVADELRAQSDRARSFSPKPGLQEPHRGLDGAPQLQEQQQQQQQPSLEADEAFSSLESSLSRLYLQEAPYSGDSYSSGVASYGPDSHSLSGSFSGYTSLGPADSTSCCSCTSCSGQRARMAQQQHHQDHHHQQQHHRDHLNHLHHLAHHHDQDYQHQQAQLHHQDQLHQQAWVSCPALPSLSRGSYSDMQYFRLPPRGRQSHSLPRDPWGRGQCCGGEVQVQALASEPSSSSSGGSSRRGLRSQLGALFPQSTVERLLVTYPHVSDMSELMRLIQNNWTSDLSF